MVAGVGFAPTATAHPEAVMFTTTPTRYNWPHAPHHGIALTLLRALASSASQITNLPALLLLTVTMYAVVVAA